MSFKEGLKSASDSLAENRVHAFLIAGVALAFLSITILFQHIKREPLDPATRCPADIQSWTILLYDQTDPYSTRCSVTLQGLIKDLGDSTQKSERLSVYEIWENSDLNATSAFDRCNPGKDANEWIENVRKMKATFKDHFQNPLNVVKASVRNQASSKHSPIVETVNTVAGQTAFCNTVPHRKIIIFSDFLQNSVNCSDYPYVSNFSAQCPPLVELHDVEVELRYILRDGEKERDLQSEGHAKKWVDRFKKAGARVTLKAVH